MCLSVLSVHKTPSIHISSVFYVIITILLSIILIIFLLSISLCYFNSRLPVFGGVPGWRFGAVYGKSGVFPSEYVHPVAAPDFLVLPPDRVEPRDRHGQVAASAAIAVAMGSSVAAHELDLSTEVMYLIIKPLFSAYLIYAMLFLL